MENLDKRETEELATEACDLQNKIKELKAKQSQVKSELFKRLKEQGVVGKGAGINTPSGSYVYSPTVSYKYPPEVEQLKKDLAIAQEKAKNEGRATKTETPNYRFKELNI